MANEYEMTALKESSENYLIEILKTTTLPNSPPPKKGGSKRFGRRDPASERVLQCLRAADDGNSPALLEECVKLYSNTDVSVDDVKSTADISDQVKAKIFGNRMDAAILKAYKLETQLEKEDDDRSKKKSDDDRDGPKRGGRSNRRGSDPKPTPSENGPTRGRQAGTKTRYGDNTRSNPDLSRSRTIRK